MFTCNTVVYLYLCLTWYNNCTICFSSKLQIQHAKLAQSRQPSVKKVKFELTEALDSCTLQGENGSENQNSEESIKKHESDGEEKPSNYEIYESDSENLPESESTRENVEMTEHSDTDSVDVLRFLLPGLCHLSAEDEPRKILLKSKAHELLAGYFKESVKCLHSDASCDNSKKVRLKVERKKRWGFLIVSYFGKVW